MRTVGLFEAKTRLSELCAEVAKAGDPLVVTRRGVPWVRIEPINKQRLTIRERRAQYLARHGHEEVQDEHDFAPPSRSKDLPEPVNLD
jgi:prevent-host-death family protein